MADINPLDRSSTYGIPAKSSDTITANKTALFSGDTPSPFTQDLNIEQNQTLEALTVVGFDATTGLVVPATSTVQAIGILLTAVTTGSTDKTRWAPVYRAGMFDPDQLVWDATLNTDALRFAAFNGAPTPTQIVMRRPQAATIDAPA